MSTSSNTSTITSPRSSNDTAGVSAVDDSEYSVASKVNTLFQRARDARRPTTAQWNRDYFTLYMRPRGVGAITSSGKPRSVPEVYPIIESLVAWKTDQNPVFDVVPIAPQDSTDYAFYKALGEDLQTAIQAAWVNQNFDDEIETGVFDDDTYHRRRALERRELR